MPSAKTASERLSTEKALQRIHDMCINNAERMMKLEEQYDRMWKSITRKDQEMETRIVNLQSECSEIRIKTTPTTLEQGRQKQIDQGKQQCHEIIQTLHSLFSKEQLEPQNIQESPTMTNSYLISTPPVLNIDDHPHCTHETVPSIPTNHIKTPKPHTIMIPSLRAARNFSGKHSSQSPNQFLICIQEYAEAVHGWDQPTLLLSISQFLRDTALDWYCQLKASHRRPQTWAEFVSLFLSQFNSSVRIARQDQEWYECKQWENETINEFFIRLHSVWSEHKPKETEVHCIKHLLCKMRNDLFTMMGVYPSASLDETKLETQKVEEILYCRNKEQCLAEYFKQISFENNTLDTQEYYNDNHTNHYKSTQFSNLEHSSSAENVSHQRNKYETKKQRNNDESSEDANINVQFTTDNHLSEKSNAIKCRSCGILGHFPENCPSNNANNFQPLTSNYRSKNGHGALGRRAVDARP